MKGFGSLKRPVTITISGESGSGKAVLAAFIAKQVEFLGAVTDFNIETENENLQNTKESFWCDTRKFVSENKNIHFDEKIIHLVIKD